MSVEVIAEIGVNHNNDLDRAFTLIEVAKESGADVVKFQASIPENEVARRYAPEHFDMIQRVVPTWAFLADCQRECERIGIEFLCTPADEESVRRLVGMGVKRLKIGSDNLTNPFVLQEAAKSGLPIILSTGMADLPQIGAALRFLPFRYVDLLHCTSAYPCSPEEANLKVLATMHFMGTLGRIGWSDHTTSLTLPAVAVGMGAEIIEKHLTFSRTAEGPDHQASLEPHQFAIMVDAIREAEKALGDGVKRPLPGEVELAQTVQKSLVARRAIRKGERFNDQNVTAKRPGSGRPATDIELIFSKLAERDYEADEQI